MQYDETAWDLFQRVTSPAIATTLPYPFAALRPRDCILVSGLTLTGKTSLLTRIAAEYLASNPTGSLVIIDNDMRFPILRLCQLAGIPPTDIEKRVYLFQPFLFKDFLLTIQLVVDLKRRDHSIHLVLIENISSFYWVQRVVSPQPSHITVKRDRNLMESVARTLEETHMACVISKPLLFGKTPQRTFCEELGTHWSRVVTSHVSLSLSVPTSPFMKTHADTAVVRMCVTDPASTETPIQEELRVGPAGVAVVE